MSDELKLLPDTRPEITRNTIPIGKLPPDQDLRSEDPVPELVNAIRSVGLLQPILVAKRDDGESYWVHGGRRRIKAVRKLYREWEAHNPPPNPEDAVKDPKQPPPVNPWSWIDAYVIDDSNMSAEEVLDIVMNSATRPNPLSELEAIQSLLAKGYSVEKISKELGLKRGTIEKRQKLMNLSPMIFDAVGNGQVKVSVAERIVGLPQIAQKRLMKTLEEKGRVTGRDVEEQATARAQVAAASPTLMHGLGALPSIDEMESAPHRTSEEREESPDGLVVGGPDPEDLTDVLEAVGYVRTRLDEILKTPSRSRPRWSVEDLAHVNTVVEKLARNLSPTFEVGDN